MTAPEITIYVRHSAGCRFSKDEFAKRCQCRKWLRWTRDGQRHREPAKTRSWAEAESVKRKPCDSLMGVVPTQTEGKPLTDALAIFKADNTNQGVSKAAHSKYDLDAKRLTA